MTSDLYPAFLSDESQYHKASAYWAAVWERIDLPEKRALGWRTPWLNASFADGSPVRDGNPIFSAWSARERKAIRVIQHEPVTEAQEIDLRYWIDTFGGGAGEPGAIRELVIVCALTEAASRKAEALMGAWILGRVEMP